MAKYVVTIPNQPDIICSSYDSARTVKGWKSIYCAPDKNKKWNDMATMPENTEVWIQFFHLPQRAKRIGCKVTFSDIPNTSYPLRMFDGWLSLDWFRYFRPDDEDMRYWQERDEYED